MTKRLFGTVALLMMVGGQMPAQQFPPATLIPRRSWPPSPRKLAKPI